MEEKKKKSKRSKQKYPGLVRGMYSKVKQEFFDIDYVDQLSEEEKAWLNNFMNGDLGANTKDNPVFEDYEEKRKCWKKNNDRNNDVYSIMRATGKLSTKESSIEEIEESDLLEDLNADLLYTNLDLMDGETITIEEIQKRVFWNKKRVFEMLNTLIKNKKLMFIYNINGKWTEDLPKKVPTNILVTVTKG